MSSKKPAEAGLPAWAWFAIFGLLSFILLAPNFGAGMGPIDDHETPWILSHTTGFASIVDFILQDFENGRFRPLYLVLRVFESRTWGEFAPLWVATRATLLATTLFLLFQTMRKMMPTSVAVFFSTLVALGRHFEIWIRLGNNETYGLPLMLGGVLAVMENRRRLGYLLILASAFCKEAFFPALAIVGFFDAIWETSQGRGLRLLRDFVLWIEVALWLICGALTVWTLKSSGLVYGGGMSLGGGWMTALSWWKQSTLMPFWGLLALAFALGWRRISKREKGLWLIFTLFSFFWVLSQGLVYQSMGFFLVTRYQVPVVLSLGTMLVPAFRLVPRMLSVREIAIFWRALALFFALLSLPPIRNTWTRSKSNAIFTRSYSDKIEQARSLLREKKYRVRLVANEPADIEYAIGTGRFLAQSALLQQSALCMSNQISDSNRDPGSARARELLRRMAHDSDALTECQNEALPCLQFQSKRAAVSNVLPKTCTAINW